MCVSCRFSNDNDWGNSGTVKIFNNAEKIYQLSKHYPVGLMVYNNADFCGTLGNFRLEALENYMDMKSIAP